MNNIKHLLNKNRLIKFIIYHITALIVLLFFAFVYRCPFLLFLKFPCPGCGITRAYLAALRLDFKSAFNYHPLFFTVLPVLLYIPHKKLFKIKISIIFEIIILCLLYLLFIIIFFARIYNQSIFSLVL